MRIYFLFYAILVSSIVNAQPTCYENKEHPLPVLSEAAKNLYAEKLSEAEKDFQKDSANADAIIWLGRRVAYTGDYQKAIDIFSRGIALHPADARLYRHRGHRYITLRCFDKAIADFKKAAELIKGKPDEVEPDGLPNAKNIPTSTLQSNIWYHLGLVYFIKMDYKKALKAYQECLKVSTNPDMYVATANWLYITLRKLDKNKEAATLLGTVNGNMELIENKDYLEILLLYKQDTDLADPILFLQKEKQGVGLASFGYGLGNYLLIKNKTAMARQVFQMIITNNQWSSFGFIAAEAELGRMK